jgi:hypothetical protein
MDMGRQTLFEADGPEPDERPYWAMTEPGVVVKVENSEVAALLVYGPVDSDRLRAIKARRLDLVGDDLIFPRWNQEAPPSSEQLEEAAREPVQYWHLTHSEALELRTYAVKDVDRLIRTHAVEEEGETVEDFYIRFAGVYRAITPHVDSPNATIAEALGLSTEIIKQYVSRCRRYGFLPPTRRSLK